MAQFTDRSILLFEGIKKRLMGDDCNPEGGEFDKEIAYGYACSGICVYYSINVEAGRETNSFINRGIVGLVQEEVTLCYEQNICIQK